MKKPNKQRRGFTLVELLVVIVIISMLAAFVAPKVMNSLSTAKVNLVKPKMSMIEAALDRFKLDCGRYPDDSEGLDALVNNPGITGWNGPYLKASALTDPWGNPFGYSSQGSINPGGCDLVSYGADGQEGGEGENADIYND